MATPSPEFGQVATGRAAKFDPWRIVVRAWWGSGKPFGPGDDFVKRPWHKVDNLKYAVETLTGEIKLADAECTIGYEIEVGYQPNVDFAKDWFKTHKQLPTAVFMDFRELVKDAVRDEATRFTADKVLDDATFLATQKSISDAIKGIFENKGITCDAYCRFGRPVIEWPKQDSDTPQPNPLGQAFYQSVKTQNAEFFLNQQRIKDNETAATEQQAAENARAVEARAASRRLDERERMTAENEDEVLKAQLEDAKTGAVRTRSAANATAELTHKRDQKKQLMDTEKELREHRMSLRQVDEDFLACETDLFRKEKERVRAEEEAKQGATEVANDREVRFIRERVLAERAVELLRHNELLKILPGVLEKVAASTQKIEHLRVVQFGNSGESGPALPNGLGVQIAHALSLIRELFRGSDDQLS